MAGMLGLSGQEFKTIGILMPRALMGKADSRREQMDPVSREAGILRKNHKEMSELKTTVIEMKTAFEGLIRRLDMAEERISELEGISVESLKTEKRREQRLNTRTKYVGTGGLRQEIEQDILRHCPQSAS